jgi:glycosyltransferase involved in cell wall biosynthesis
VISISQITLDRFKRWAGEGARSYAVLPNAIRAADYGADRKRRDLAERLGLDGRTVIMTFGRMSADEQYKGFDEVLEVLPRLRSRTPRIAYLIVGDGSDRERLAAKARRLGVSDLVVFAGRVSDAEKADHYRLADAYVMPSSGEGFGFVVLEALACGLPVVASEADGTREAVRGGELGILVDPADPDALESAILEALSRPKRVPPGIGYFSFSNFEQRLNTAVVRVLEAEPA